MGRKHVFIATESMMHRLFAGKEKRGLYFDRPNLQTAEKNSTQGWRYLPFMSYSSMSHQFDWQSSWLIIVLEHWTKQRRFSKQILTQSYSAGFHGIIQPEAICLLKALASPTDTNTAYWKTAIDNFTSETSCTLAYGNSTHATQMSEASIRLLTATSASVTPLGLITPRLQWLPYWLLPSTWNTALRMKREEDLLTAAQRSQPRSNVPTWTESLLSDKKRWSFSTDSEGIFAVGMHAIIGATAPSAAIQSFILAIAHHPELQPLLHEETDRVVGFDRLPVLSDLPHMPVTRAFLCETLRWRPTNPPGIPRTVHPDDEVDGYRIPAGAWVHPLQWSIAREEARYPDPEVFNPRRWLDPTYPTYHEPLEKYPTIVGSVSFGFGDRECPGARMVEAMMFLSIASMAWLFKFGINRPAGDDTDYTLEYTPLLITKPKAFPLKLTVRSAERLALVERLPAR
jgi:cytochrome P450